MAGDPNKKLPKAGGSGVVMLTPETYEALRSAAERPVPVLDSRFFDSSERAGRIFYSVKPKLLEALGGNGGGKGRFLATYDAATLRLYVSPGCVAFAEDPEDEVVRPMMAEIDEVPLDGTPRPFFDCTGMSGSYELMCEFGGETAQLQLIEEGTAGGGGEEEEEEESSKTVFLLARVTILPGGASIEQLWESDITWPSEDESSSSGSESSGEDGGGGGGGSDSGSEKSTAIVPASWTPGGYVALFAMEAPDVRFTDILRASLKARVTRLKLDPRFVEVCELGSIVVASLTPEQPMRLGARVEGGFVIITRSIFSGPCPTVVCVSGIRRGFAGMRFTPKTATDFQANERFLQSARPQRS